MNRSMHGVAEKSKEGFEHLKEDASQLAEDVTRLGHTIQNLAADSLGSVQKKFSGLYESGQDKVAGIEKKIINRVKERPLQTLFMAAGIGFILGWMKGR